MRVFTVSGNAVNGGETITIRHQADGNVERIGFRGIPTLAAGQIVKIGASRLIHQGDMWVVTLPMFTEAFVARIHVEYGSRTWDSDRVTFDIDPDDVIAVNEAFTAANFKAVTDELTVARGESESLGDRLDAADEADEALGERIDAVENPGIVTVAESRTLALTDAWKFLVVGSAADAALTIPLNADAAFPVGAEITVFSDTEFAVSIARAEGVTTHSDGGLLNIKPFCAATLKKIGEDAWFIYGALVAAV